MAIGKDGVSSFEEKRALSLTLYSTVRLIKGAPTHRAFFLMASS